jgi:hypothetical protein
MSYCIPLRDLSATFVTIVENGFHIEESRELTPTVQGLWFVCPCCYAKNNYSDIGVHHILCWFRDRGVPAIMTPGPGRWTPSGTGIDDITFVIGSPPMLYSVQADCHFYIKNGQAVENEADALPLDSPTLPQ